MACGRVSRLAAIAMCMIAAASVAAAATPGDWPGKPGDGKGRKSGEQAVRRPPPSRSGSQPPLLSEYPVPPPKANPDSNLVPQEPTVSPYQPVTAENGKMLPAADKGKSAPEAPRPWPGRSASPPDSGPAAHAPEAEAYAADEIAEEEAPPTPADVEQYRIKLEARLLDRYNNELDNTVKAAKVEVILSKPLETSLDGKFIRAEFDQLVYDVWGRRMPRLEKEYYVVVFATGGAEQVRTDPSVRVGLDMENVYSENAPPVSDVLAGREKPRVGEDAPSGPMPEWWRPNVDALRE